MLIGMMGLHPEKGGILAHRDLNHKWTVDRALLAVCTWGELSKSFERTPALARTAHERTQVSVCSWELFLVWQVRIINRQFWKVFCADSKGGYKLFFKLPLDRIFHRGGLGRQ